MKRFLSLVLTMALIMAIAPTSFTASAANLKEIPANGEYVRILYTAGNQDKYVDVPAESLNDNTQLQLWKLAPGNVNQIFYLVVTPDGVQIYSAASGRVLAVVNNSHSDCAAVIQTDNLTKASSYWDVIDKGNGIVSFRNRESGLYLNVCGGGNGYNGQDLIQYHDDGTVAMRFRLERYTNPYNYTVPSRAIWYRSYSVMTGRDVGFLQSAMNLFGNYHLELDQSFGPACASAAQKLQVSLNLTPDGSCGPATQAKILNWLNSFAIKPAECNSKISSARIQSVLDQYGYKDGRYWVYSAGGSRYSGYTATTQNRGRSFSYNFEGSVECAGFAGFVMTQVTGSYAYGGSGWTKIAGESNITELRVGDIIRTSGHSAVVLSINSDGTITFAECWGSVNCMINIGKFNNTCATLKQIKDKYTVSHIWRYIG